MYSSPIRSNFLRVTSISCAFALFTLLATANPASAQYVIQGQTYNTVGSSEDLIALFTQADGGVTQNMYHDFVLVDVSGTGVAGGSTANDSFYSSDDGFATLVDNFGYYQLTFDTQSIPPADQSRNAQNFIVFDVAADTEVSPSYVPSFNSDHVYHFILDTQTLGSLANLHFGVNDGDFGDNSGQYNLRVTQLSSTVPQDVPEPSVSAMFIGLAISGSLFASRRLRRK